MIQFAADITALMPPFRDMDQSRSDDRLVESIEATRPAVLQFSRLAEVVALTRDGYDAGRAVYAGFTHLLDLYWLPRGYTGAFYQDAFALAQFIGHETFVIFFSLLIREERWQLIADLLDEDLFVNNQPGGRRGTVSLGYVSQHVRLLDVRTQRLKLNYTTMHGYLLNERHKQGDLADIVPMEQFVDADYFLYLRGQLWLDQADGSTRQIEWRPWSSIYMRDVPRYLDAAIRPKGAQNLLRALSVDDMATLRGRFAERVLGLGEVFDVPYWRDPMARFNPEAIGTRP